MSLEELRTHLTATLNRDVGTVEALAFQSAAAGRNGGRKDLLARGWPEDEINRGMAAITPPTPPSLHAIPDEPDGAHDDDARLLAPVRSGAWLDAQTFPPLAYAVDRIIPEGLGILSGSPKVGKSWLALDLCLSVASGGLAFGSIPIHEPRRVLYLALEDGDRRLQDRIRSLAPGEQIPPNFHYLTRLAGSVRHTLRAWLRQHPGTGMAIVDTLGRVMPPAKAGQTSYERDYAAMSQLQEIASDHPGLALLLIHHTRKQGADDFADSTSGTRGITGSADTVITLTRDRHTDRGLLSVTGRDVQEAEYAVDRVEGGGWRMAGGDPLSARLAADEYRAAVQLDRHGDRMREVVDLVNSRASTAPKDVAEALGIAPKDAVQYLGRAVNSGLIDKAGRGQYLPNPQKVGVASVVSVVSESDDPSIRQYDTYDTHLEDDSLPLSAVDDGDTP